MIYTEALQILRDYIDAQQAEYGDQPFVLGNELKIPDETPASVVEANHIVVERHFPSLR